MIRFPYMHFTSTEGFIVSTSTEIQPSGGALVTFEIETPEGLVYITAEEGHDADLLLATIRTALPRAIVNRLG